MKVLLVFASLLAVPGPGRAGEPPDPAAAATTATPDAPPDAKKRAPGRSARDPKERRGATAAPAREEAAPKDEKPCEPVKPCAID